MAKTQIRDDEFDDDRKMEMGKKGFGKAKQVMFYPFHSKNGSPTDPNHRKFTNEMLKVLIEKNDFYSKESNPHLDVQVDTRQKH
ncbi:putative lysozyme-like protein [Cucumis melo var. makuwa]|uniref:Lysozyme-like protein n=1 Tax=Cucumis melo var. makuwa TaxID=1194695 RepID=A0A5D3B980_CUCMM|nr:putative lysozyme-like protein [Cucumis melo var. makuwa]TYJ96422.1 putative lysozyme-like protein [Cucumis melo var. makuwa]